MDVPHHLDLKGFGYCHQWEEQEGRREPGVVGAAGQVSVLAWLMMKILLKRGKGLLLYQGMGCGVACSSKWPGELARLQQGMTTRERTPGSLSAQSTAEIVWQGGTSTTPGNPSHFLLSSSYGVSIFIFQGEHFSGGLCRGFIITNQATLLPRSLNLHFTPPTTRDTDDPPCLKAPISMMKSSDNTFLNLFAAMKASLPMIN